MPPTDVDGHAELRFATVTRLCPRLGRQGCSEILDSRNQNSYYFYMKTRVSERGQITIPKAVRERLGIRPSQVLEVREHDGAVVAYKAATVDPLEALTGIIETDRGTDELIEEIRGGEADAV